MEPANAVKRRLQALANHTVGGAAPAPPSMGAPLLVLPDGGIVNISQEQRKEGSSKILHNGAHILSYTVDAHTALAFDAAVAGTRFHGVTTHIPAYPLLTLSAPNTPTAPGFARVAVEDCWTAVYALFTLFYTQEHVPAALGAIANASEIRHYLLTSGLGRACPASPTSPPAHTANDVLFLSRATFWQGAGITGFHPRQHWLLTPRPPLPPAASYTRSERVIAVHPLRPTKPAPGEVLYRRWCGALRETIDITHFDVDGVRDADYGVSSGGAGGVGGAEGGRVSRHLAAFHRWHNDARVNAAWGERGALAAHRAYIDTLLADPHALPCMLSWNGELMGYVEIVYTKEDHVAMNYPAGVVPGEWERGIHVLVGEEKFLGNGRGAHRFLRCVLGR